ncbi:DNA (cytosine-5)-methyltransferase 3A [Fopius arisanus]|uniref:DNA (cytosine-5-)-methyltransferase n=1 Tax=Fopius arisanus TaxID=64838 RepID=A0A9R1TUW1_9HYME|nr:PREDICTED: DNA (cytosine-5)-methyltransferase 3A-like [Fopius arisanus]
MESQKIGAITWAKIPGQIWWPAMIIDYRDCAMNEPKAESQWVMWYGDYTLSQVNYKYFMEFRVGIKKFEDHIRQSKRETYKRGILEASKDYCTFSGCQTDNWDINDIFNWFQVDNPSSNYLDNENNKYSPKIRMELLKHVSRTSEAAVREHKLQNTEILRVISSHHSDTEKSICLMCLERNQRTMHEHPFFIGLLCDNCMISYRSTIFAYDDDGKCFFCALCTVTDTVVICDNPDCPRVYCTVCMKYLIAPDSYREVLKKKEWNCFLCSESSHVLSNSLVNPRDDWKMRIQKMFSINRHSISHYMQYYEQKKKIRVLSLFDGISSGFLGLQRLGIDIDAYFASEIDTDAELVSKVHFGTTIIRLGDVRNITREILNNLLPIDLLIGGSPCNDLSLVNPKRRGIHDPNGTGILFFEYCRIKNDIEEANEGRNLFWLFENVASMPEEYKKEIDKNLRCEPDLIDSAEFSPQHRPRYYWTNIPMASYTPLVKDLQDVLTPNCNRHALVKKIRTVTTQLKSLKQGSRALKPIIMGEEYDCLWTTELEEIFGFPRHYTDIKNLSATKRQKLIGQAWCVRTITEILRPLKHYFSLNKICN